MGFVDSLFSSRMLVLNFAADFLFMVLFVYWTPTLIVVTDGNLEDSRHRLFMNVNVTFGLTGGFLLRMEGRGGIGGRLIEMALFYGGAVTRSVIHSQLA